MHDGGELGEGALTVAGAAGRGDVDRRTCPESWDGNPGHVPMWRTPIDGSPPPLGPPALVGAAGRLAAAGTGRSRPIASLGHVVCIAIVPAGNGPPAALVCQVEVDQAGRLMYHLHGMYLAVLSVRMGEEVAAR